jgi:uncharacterized protein (DUF2062 family)
LFEKDIPARTAFARAGLNYCNNFSTCLFLVGYPPIGICGEVGFTVQSCPEFRGWIGQTGRHAAPVANHAGRVMLSGRGLAFLKGILRSFAWPRRGFGRVWRYLILRLLRLKASPHKAALGFAAGAAVSFTPFIGFHFILAAALAFVTRGSLIAALLGTIVGNPFTFPIIFTASYWIGDRMKELAAGGPGATSGVASGGSDDTSEAEAAAEALLDMSEVVLEEGNFRLGIETIWPVFSTMLLGSVPLFIIAYALFYFLAKGAILALSRNRTHKP